MNTRVNQHIWSQFETHQQPTRVVLLGASNLSRSFPWAVDAAQQSFRSPLSIHAAMGFGRSYGIESGFLGKKFSGIFSARIWEALDGDRGHSTIAFVTDIGNDLAYEQPVNAIMKWVEGCVTRLNERGASVAMTGLPIDVLRGVSRAKFQLLRAVLFPRCCLSWIELLTRAEELSERVIELAESRNIPIFTAPAAWYGFDPIHPRGTFMKDYWREQFAAVRTNEPVTESRRKSLSTYWRLRTLRSPGLGQKASPGRFSSRELLLGDGTSVALY